MSNKGSSLMTLATVLLVLNLIGYGIGFLLLITVNFLYALLVAIVGCISAYVSYLLLYTIGETAAGVGQLQGDTSYIRSKLDFIAGKLSAQPAPQVPQAAPSAAPVAEEAPAGGPAITEEPVSGDLYEAFLVQAQRCANMRQLQGAWNYCQFPETAETKEIAKMIADGVQSERLYGVDSTAVQKILNKVRMR